jgi:hypothetical protein
MGTLFGLTELAMCCYKKKNNKFIINLQGWDDLKYEFKVKSFIEVSTSRLDGTRCTHIRLGFPTDKPTVIWNLQECIARYRKEEYRIEINSEGSDSGNNALYICRIFLFFSLPSL